MEKFICSTCNEEHDLEDLSFGADSPKQWDGLTDKEKEQSELDSDTCFIKTSTEEHFFIRGCLDIPITGSDKIYTWGVWVSLSEKSMLEVCDNWENPERAQLGPYFGWFCTEIPTYPDTLFLKASVSQQPVGVRPRIELEPTDHPLAIHQRNGIDPEILKQKLLTLLHV